MLPVAIWLRTVLIDDAPRQKISSKHGLVVDDVIEAFQWPAEVQVAVEDHPEHGWRVIALGVTYDGKEVIGYLFPEPPEAMASAETWFVGSARTL